VTDVTLTAEEWDKAMAFVLAGDDEAPTGSTKDRKPPPRRRPAYTVKALDTGDSGDKWTALMPPAGQVTTYTEIPPSGPADSGVTKDPATPGTPDKWAIRIGTPQPTGTPNGGSFASTSGTPGWSTTVGTPQGTQTVLWNATPSGSSDGTGPSGDPTTTDTLNRAPRTSLASTEDLYTTPGGNAALPDGSFMICSASDVQNCVDKVKNADEANPRRTTHPWYADVKAHIARRASDLGVSNLVPADWKLS